MSSELGYEPRSQSFRYFHYTTLPPALHFVNKTHVNKTQIEIS